MQHVSAPAQRIILADKLHNLRSLLANWQQFGNAIWAQFSGQPLDYLALLNQEMNLGGTGTSSNLR
ncbi:hypothetical protein [Sphaerothrix gracilis]|uniref:hypothetical protein n=1 Tax=Sphaerothrix gracilis TaxID=3151835 RepID=UPI0031FCD0F1